MHRVSRTVLLATQPKPLLIRLVATTFNRFPTREDYVGWFTDAGLSDVQTK